MTDSYFSFKPGQVHLNPGLFQQRTDLNRAYLLSLTNENLLQNHYLEAGMGDFNQLRNSMHGTRGAGDDRHWGWESPTCQLRGHFLGHWLSAAARHYATTGDMELKFKADHIVAELDKCQKRNGGEWVFSIPEKYLHWIAAGKPAWSPHYVVHKTFLGLLDTYRYTANAQALTIVKNAAHWFLNWTNQYSRQQMDDILEIETGGMLEIWADLYGITHAEQHMELLDRYTHRHFFEQLLQGEDALTNQHANTTIPEILGAARAFEVTGDSRWKKIVEKYWHCAVTFRGSYCTGGQTSGEIWTPPFEFSARRGDKNQEHCTVYNMIRLADFLFRMTGQVEYADYIESNIYNGILAQQHPQTGMVSYFLPLEAGGTKKWGSPTWDFWCCHGTLVQAHTCHNAHIFYGRGREIVIAQFIPSYLQTAINGTAVNLDMKLDHHAVGSADDNSSAAGTPHRPDFLAIVINMICDNPIDIVLKFRIPGWCSGPVTAVLNGESLIVEAKTPGFHVISRTWHNDTLLIKLPKQITTSIIPDEPETMAFLDGPVVLAGLCDKEYTIRGDQKTPEAILKPDNERQWGQWLDGYRSIGQDFAIRFKPLYKVVDEPYTIYFPLKSR